MAVIKKNTSDIRQTERTGLQTLEGFLSRSRNGCITNEDLIEAIFDSLAEQNVNSFYNNGTINWNRDPVENALHYFTPSFRRRHDPDTLCFSEFVTGAIAAVNRSFIRDPESDAPMKIFQSLSSSSLCFVNKVYDGKENVR